MVFNSFIDTFYLGNRRLFFIILFLLLLFPSISLCALLGSAEISVLGIQVNVDTRPDIEGFQSTMTVVKNFPAAVDTFVGFPGIDTLPALSSGFIIKAELSGPAFVDEMITISSIPNELMELPNLKVSGDYFLNNIRLEDEKGNLILERDPTLESVVINVIDKLLVTQVTSRPLTLEEIEEKGIVINDDSFTAMNFTVGLTLGQGQGAREVIIDLPMLIPSANNISGIAQVPDASTSYNFEPGRFDNINIPNLSLTGFTMTAPPELEEEEGIKIPPVNGVIVIPGNIAFLKQHFSVILQATNAAPEGAGLNLENASAAIILPQGDDEITGTGDDPLSLAETQEHGMQEELPLLDLSGSSTIVPQGTNQSEFLVVGDREGTHRVNFDITGDLFIPSLGKTFQMSGKAAGIVQVKNPTFSMTLAHPETVRNGENYSLFATVTNTSLSPANLFQLKLNTRSLSGTMPAEGETGLKTLDTLAPGQAETFEFRLVSRTTGKVSGTVFLADQGINGNFVLTTGVGDTGIPLSPDTLILPRTTDYLPDDPDLVFAAVRLLGQAYSIATAPGGSLPADITRMSRSYVFDRGVKLAQAGLHIHFGENIDAAVQDILMNYLGNDMGRLEQLYEDTRKSDAVKSDMLAFDSLRRKSDAGHYLSDVLGELIGKTLTGQTLADLQKEWAQYCSSKPAHLSFGINSPGTPVYLRMSDPNGNTLGTLNESDEIIRDIPFADIFILNSEPDNTKLLFAASPEAGSYTFEFSFPQGVADAELSLILPNGDNMKQIIYSAVTLPLDSQGIMVFNTDGSGDMTFGIDTDKDGATDLVLTPDSVIEITDIPPSLISVMQWAKGDTPMPPGFEYGDPLGRMIGVLFSEEVEILSAEDGNNYKMENHNIGNILLQPDRRMVFMMLDEPAGSFISRVLAVSDIKDMKDQPMISESLELTGDPERGTAGIVSGIVQGPDGTPMPFAQVQYIQPVLWPNENFGAGQVKQTIISDITADAEGRWQIEFVLAADIGNFTLEAADPVSGDTGKISTRVQSEGQHMNLAIITRGYGSVKGTVFEEDGSIVSQNQGISVIAKSTNTNASWAATLDSSGQYSFPKLSVGNVVLQIVRPGDGFTGIATVNIPGAGMSITQDIFLISSNNYGTVSGRILENDGITGAAGVQVQIAGQVLTSISTYSREYDFGLAGSAETDENGLFIFENVPAGDIDIRAFRQATYEQTKTLSYIQEGEEKTLILILPGTGGTIRGYVRDASGNMVNKAQVAGGPVLTETDEDGYFELPGLPLGKISVYAQASGSRALGTVSADIVSSDDILEVLITLEPTGSIMGTVFEADGVTPVPLQKVQLWTKGGVIAEGYTDEQGNYQFNNYPVNPYTVKAIQANYGDGGMTVTEIRYSDDSRDADIVFRGMGEVKGRVIQSNGTPVITNVVVTRKVWKIIPNPDRNENNYYLDFAEAASNVIDAQTDSQGFFDEVIAAETSGNAPVNEFFMLMDESVAISSDILGTGGEVTGEFHFTGPITGGTFKVSAFGPFLAPADVSGEIPKTTDPDLRIVDVGDIILEPATGEIVGTVYMPDGITLAGENIKVSLSGAVSGINVTTDENGQFYFPLVARGGFTLTADTGVPPMLPDGPGTAVLPADMETEKFYNKDCDSDDVQCKNERSRVLNVRLYGQTGGSLGSLKAGEPVTADIRLHDAAGIRVKVVKNDGETPVPFAVVTLKTSSTLDTDQEKDSALVTADENGIVDFFPVIEGSFSVSAKDPDTQATGQISGKVPENPENGLLIPITITLGAVTTDSGQIIVAETFGTVEGTVFKADGSPLENPAQITIKASGANLISTSGSDGRYHVEYVPGGKFQVEVFEPLTARTGTASGNIFDDGDIADIPVTLIGLGTVNGQVFDQDGIEPVAGADVLLYPSGSFSSKMITRTDTTGSYWFPGVPIGEYSVKATDYASGLTGTGSGFIAEGGGTDTTDILMEASGTLTGIVYDAGVFIDEQGNTIDADGNPWPNTPVVSNANVTIKKPGIERKVQTNADGTFASGEFLPMGTYKITAEPQGTNDGTSSFAVLSYNGQVEYVKMALNGTGIVQGNILDSACNTSIDKARVTIKSQSPFSAGPVTKFTGADGEFVFNDIPAGIFSISVETSVEVPQLGTTVTGRIVVHNETIIFADNDSDIEHNAICLQESGRITGTVVQSGGTSPAQGAVIEINSKDIRLSILADSAGEFSFDGLPLETYSLSILEPVTNGVASRTIVLGTNGQIVDTGMITVDSDAPAVISTSPAANASDTNPADPVIINFSENINAASVNSETFRIISDGKTVSGTVSVSGNTLTFVPDNVFSDLKRISVYIKGDKIGFEGEILEHGIYDLSGLGMTSDYNFSFSTADTTPPQVTGISPDNLSSEISLTSVIRVEFSEPINRETISSFTLTENSTPVSGSMNTEPIFGDQVFVFSPDEKLLPNREYTAVLSGSIEDLAGNKMVGEPIISTFATIDTLAPVITSLNYTGDLIQGKTIDITMIPETPADVEFAEFYLNGEFAASITQPSFTYSAFLDPVLGSEIVVKAVAIDSAGNRSEQKEIAIAISVNQPPSINITSENTSVSQGQTVIVTLDASDDVGLTGISLTADNGQVFAAQETLEPVTSFHKEFAFKIPADYSLDSGLILQSTATDTLGQVSMSEEISLAVNDTAGPKVMILSPGNNNTADPGDHFAVMIRADDSSGISSITLTAKIEDATVFNESRTVEPSISPALITFDIIIPEQPGSTIILLAEAEDTSGNTGTSNPIKLNIFKPVHVVSIEPEESASGIPVMANVTVRFSSAIDPDSITGESFKVLHQDISMPGTSIPIEDNTKIVWVPDSAFSFNQTYNIVISDEIKDETGKTISPFTSVFTVTDFAIIRPAENEQVVEEQTLLLGSDGTNTQGINAVNYLSESLPIGTGTSLAPYDFNWQIPVYGTESSVNIGAEAVAGGSNLAQSAGVSASVQTYDYDFAPERAVDNDTDDSFIGGSVAAVIGNPGWWQADIGRIARIQSIDIHFHDECCSENNRIIVLSAVEPFIDSDFNSGIPGAYSNNAVEVYKTGNDPEIGVRTISGPFIGRYIRIVHTGNDFLGLAEVQVYETMSKIPMEPVQITVSPAE